MRLSIPEHKRFVHEVVVPIRWGDMDAMGHVNNTIYFRYMEIVRLDWLLSLGRGAAPQGQGPVIVNAFCNFHQELRHPGDVRVRMYVANPGRSSFETYYALSRVDDPDALYASGGAKTVWIDHGLRKSVPLPEELRRLVGEGDDTPAL